MKTVKFYAIMMAVALCAVTIASCSTDEEDITLEETQYQGRVTVFNQVRYLQNNIVEVDSLGNFVQRVSGAPLNPADTTELYIGVANLPDAAEMFQGWLSLDTEMKLSAPSTVDMEAGLKDENGQLQETVYFKVVDEAPTLAEVTFAKGPVMKHVSKIIFIKESAWPENDYSPYLIGDQAVGGAVGGYVCIREAKNGISGLLMYITRDTSVGIYKSCPSVSLATEASKILRADWDAFVLFFSSSSGSLLKKDTFYWTNERDDQYVRYKDYAINLSEGTTDWFETKWKKKELQRIYIKTFDRR